MPTEITRFWEWFEQNNKGYLFLNEVDQNIKENLLNNLMENLHQYCSGLYFEIGGPSDQNKELIITAEGDINYFDAVELLIASAPQIENWTFIAFIPSREADFTTIYEDVSLDPKNMWFQPLEHPEMPAAIGIKVCSINYELVKNSKWLRPAVYKILDSILGEKSFALDVNHIDIGQLPDEPDEDGMIRLSELPEYVKWKKLKYGSGTKNS